MCRKIRRDPNNNVTIPAIAVKRTQIAVYAAKYYDLVGRAIDAHTMAWDRICHFTDLKAIEEEYSNPEQIAPVTKKLNIMKWVELLEEHVRKERGARKIPLSYLIRTAHVSAPVTPFRNEYYLPYDGKENDFELAADYLLKMLLTRSRDNVSSYQVSALEFEFDHESDIPTKGPSTGVDVRYHTKEEYNKVISR